MTTQEKQIHMIEHLFLRLSKYTLGHNLWLLCLKGTITRLAYRLQSRTCAFFSSSLLPAYFRTASDCFQSASGLLPICLPMCFWSASSLLFVCFWSASGLLLVCFRSASSLISVKKMWPLTQSYVIKSPP